MGMAPVPPRDDPSVAGCGVCRVHADPDARQRWEIGRHGFWLLRHHPDPAPLAGWLILDAWRHLSGPIDFHPAEAREWGGVVQAASILVRNLTGCDRVYAVLFGEGARHLHLHLIPRSAGEVHTEAWAVADHYRAVARGQRAAADPRIVRALVEQARSLWREAGPGSTLAP
jgi:diadenosine tetraphosphate (Ap4A) HIT family hydrolase